jgi:hypothetical protein
MYSKVVADRRTVFDAVALAGCGKCRFEKRAALSG